MVTWIPHKKPPNLCRRFDPFTEMNDDELDDAMAAPVDREAAALQLSKLLKDWDNVIHGVAVGSIIDAVISMSFQCHFMSCHSILTRCAPFWRHRRHLQVAGVRSKPCSDPQLGTGPCCGSG